jgi:hypothetical protein
MINLSAEDAEDAEYFAGFLFDQVQNLITDLFGPGGLDAGASPA